MRAAARARKELAVQELSLEGGKKPSARAS
jgi:hypothetical protein